MKYYIVSRRGVSFLILFFFLVSSYSTVPITNRKRVNVVSDEQILPASFAQYEGFLNENKKSTIQNLKSRLAGEEGRFSFLLASK